jgi:ribosomal protein L37AE/L43A
MFLQNKYSECYNRIVKAATSRQRPKVYCEKHHIIPKSLGGLNDKTNLVFLTAREHFVCHKLLPKMLDGLAKHKMVEAIAIFSNNKNRNLVFNSRDIALIREANASASSKRNKGNEYYKHRKPASDSLKTLRSENAKKSKWINNGSIEFFTEDFLKLVSEESFSYGRLPFSKEHLINLGGHSRPHTEETRAKISAGNKGKIVSDIARQNMSISNLQRSKGHCPFCLKTMDLMNFGRWHGDKCKAKITELPSA